MKLYAIIKYFNFLTRFSSQNSNDDLSRECRNYLNIDVFKQRIRRDSFFFFFLISFQGFFRPWMAVYPVSRSFQCRHLHVTAVISFPTWKSSLLLVCFLPCVILRGKVCLTNLGASYLTAATTWRKQILARNFVATSIDPLELRTKLPSFICFFFFFVFF